MAAFPRLMAGLRPTLLVAFLALLAPVACAQPETEAESLPETNYYAIEVPQGRMVVRLYDRTPRHRDNFKRLVEDDFYDGTTFHRIIRGFMAQGGDPNSRDDDPTNDGQGDPGYTLEAEIGPNAYHVRGALAAARQGDAVNPERRSSGSQFYLVHGGRPIPPPLLEQVEVRMAQVLGDTTFAYPDSVRQRYLEEGGAPHLDGQYTIFGELVEGFPVLDSLAAVPTPRALRQRAHPAAADRPLEDVPMTVRPLPDYEPPEE